MESYGALKLRQGPNFCKSVDPVQTAGGISFTIGTEVALVYSNYV